MYSFQQYSSGSPLRATQIQQTEDNVRDHVHGVGSVSAVFESGVVMVFAQATAPTGWVKVSSSGVHDAGIRIVTSVCALGGSDLFSGTFNGSASTQAHSLTVAQIPPHTHTVYAATAVARDGAIQTLQVGGPDGTLSTRETGGGQGHVHLMGFDVRYVDLLWAVKS